MAPTGFIYLRCHLLAFEYLACHLMVFEYVKCHLILYILYGAYSTVCTEHTVHMAVSTLFSYAKRGSGNHHGNIL